MLNIKTNKELFLEKILIILKKDKGVVKYEKDIYDRGHWFSW